MSARPLVLITRPVGDGRTFADDLARGGVGSLLEPMLEIVSFGFIAPDLSRYQAVLVSSANALRVFCAQVSTRDIRVYTVGNNTQAAALDEGFADVVSAEGNVDDLVVLVSEGASKSGLPLLHVRGEDVAKPLDEMLVGHGFEVESLIVYKAELIDEFSAKVLGKIKNGSVNVVALFSKRTANNFIKLMDENGLGEALEGIKALCISSDVLECVRLHSWEETYIAQTPDRAGMLALVKSVCAGDE